MCSLLVLASCGRSIDHPLCGDWVNRNPGGPQASYLHLEAGGDFSLGDLADGREREGVTGTWSTDEGRLILEVATSASCKVPDGVALRFRWRLDGEALLLTQEGAGTAPTRFVRR